MQKPIASSAFNKQINKTPPEKMAQTNIHHPFVGLGEVRLNRKLQR